MLVAGFCLPIADVDTQKKGWGQKVDKTHHVKVDVLLAHADKCLELGEKPFVSGGMKASSGLK